MKKKVKKIPKYSGGTISADVLDKTMAGKFKTPIVGSTQTKPMTSLSQHSRAIGGAAAGESGSSISLPGGIATASNEILMNTLGIEDNSQAGVTLNAAAQGSDIGGSIMPGWGHLIGAIAGGTIGSFKKGSVDEFGNITYGGIFGRSKESLLAESNRKKNSMITLQQTLNLQADYYNNPNNPNGGTILAAEGGIIPNTLWYEDDGEYGRTPYGEIYKEPEQGKPKDSNLVQGPAGTQILSDKLKYPGTKDTFAKHYEKSIAKVKNYGNDKYAKNSQLLNDKYAQRQFDEHLAVLEEMKNKKIKKVKNGIPAHQGGYNGRTSYTGVSHYDKQRKLEPLQAVEWNGRTGYFDVDGGFHELPPNPALWPDSVYLGRYKDIPVSYTLTKNLQNNDTNSISYPTGAKYPMDPIEIPQINWNSTQTPKFAPNPNAEPIIQNTNNGRSSSREIDLVDFYTPRLHGTANWGTPVLKNKKDTDIDGTTSAAEVVIPVSTAKTVVTEKPTKSDTTIKQYSKNKIKKQPVSQKTKLTPEQIAESLRIADIGERHWLRGSVSEPNQSLAGLAQTTPEKLKIQKLAAPSSPRTYVDHNDPTDFNTNWGDLAYKVASIFTPLFDREKAESVQYQVPIAKYRPTSVNIDPQRRAIDESYAMARYNQANISPNTGAGMAYGLQAATNRAKQLSDVYGWQMNTQNNLIGQNVDTYNKWSADYANIMNNVYDKAAANRATARNINRQNVATALKNWGQIRRDDKAYEMDRMKLLMLDPMLQYGYENYDNYLKWKKENGYG